MPIMKAGVRVLAIACAPLRKKKTLLFGIVSRKDEIEGALSMRVTVDGTDSTQKLILLLKKSRFRDQVRVLATNGVGIAGLNVLNIKAFEKEIGVKVISVTRKRPRPIELIKALKALSKAEKQNVNERIRFVKELNDLNVYKIDNLYIQTSLEKHDAAKFAKSAFERVRLAHLIASGVSAGESRGSI